jgi:hypothetical protein
MTAYTGYLTRMAHFSAAADVAPGVNPEHEHPDPDPDIFDPKPGTPAQQGGDVWMPAEVGFASEMQVQPITHWYNGQLAVPSSVPYGTAQLAMQERMMADHEQANYRPDTIRLYQHATEGQTIDYVKGRAPQNAGTTLPDGAQYLANGRNSYDQTNVPNEVYSADEGRYRLGYKINDWGEYRYPIGRFGQDAQLRAYTGLTPTFPADKPAVTDAAPYTPNSSGTTTWTTPQWQVPSLFGLPSETQVTDYTTSAEGWPAENSDFGSGERL